MDEPTREELAKRLERARRAQREAESVAEAATSDLFTAVQELQALNQTMRDFVAAASHDLKTPITVIAGYASTLQERWDDLKDPDKRRFLGLIERSGHQLAALVDDLLTVTRIESGAIDPHREDVELRAAMEELAPAFAEPPQVAVCDGLRVLVDPGHLRRILANYLTNAFKYGEPPVRVDAHDGDGAVVIRVRDAGECVPHAFVPRLFGKFTRADASRSKDGTGLGLSIVAGLAQANGGEAWYEPNHPRGSCFAVRLPVPGC